MLDLTITYVLWAGGGAWSVVKVVADLSGVVYAGRVVARVVRRRVRARKAEALPFAEEIREPVGVSA